MMGGVWAIILAAGASTRMKRQKLLLQFNDKTIIETVIENAARSVGSKIMVVLGSHRVEISTVIKKYGIKITINENYLNGMLSSAICGFRALPVEAKAALIFLGDQPQITSDVTDSIISKWKDSGKGIIVPTFNGKRGHPVLIETRFKSEIEKLEPDKGLKQLLLKFGNEVVEVESDKPEILRDIDTPEEYETEINKIN